MPLHRYVALSLLGIGLGIGPGMCSAIAQPASAVPQGGDAGESGRRVFQPAWFSGSAPATALDMVRRLPGFTIVEADEDVRGYAGAQGNVLVDGVRPGSKREDIAQWLERIPAASVERIELIRAADGGIDMAGHALLVNVVRAADPAPELAVQGGVALATDGWAAPVGSLEYGRQWGASALELALSSSAESDEDGGPGRIVTRAADGTVVERARTDDRSIATQDEASLHWRQPWIGGRLNLHAAAVVERQAFESRVDHVLPDSGREDIDERERLRQAEFGARWSRVLAGNSTLTAMASRQSGWLDAAESARDEDGEERFSERTRTGESLAGITFGWQPGSALSMVAGIEGAYNTLRSRADLVEDGLPVDLPGSRVGVAERRMEGSIAGTWQPAQDWQLDGGLRVEASRLDQSGQTRLSRRFAYVKPHAGATHDFGDGQEVRLSLSRELGQLDFGDFVASASLATGDVSAGNVLLEPDKTWRAVLSWKREFGDDGAIALAWTHDRISDVVDRVPLLSADGELFDAPGNLGDGIRNSLALELGGSLARLGMPGVRVDAEVVWLRSRVRDPATGGRRTISEDKPLEGELSFSQSLPRWNMTWGASVELAEREAKYRYDRITREYEGRRWSLFAERRFGTGWRWRAEVRDPTGLDVWEGRDSHDGARGATALEETEIRRHRAPGLVLVTLRRDIGG